MKLKDLYILIALTGIFMLSCDNSYEHYDGIYVSGTLGNNPMISLTVDDNFPKTVDLTVASSNLVTKDIMIEMEVNASTVDAYNKKFQTNYTLLPEKCYVLTHPTVIIEKGNYATTASVKLNIISIEGLMEGKKYMVPVTITKVSEGYPVIQASKTVYIVLNQVIVTSALNLGQVGYVYTEFNGGTEEAKTKYNTRALPAITFEMRAFIHSIPIKGFNTFMGLEENFVIRTNTFDDGSGVLDCTGYGMGNIKTNSRFPVKAWTHVAATYDSRNSVVTLYINGDQVASRAVTRKKPLIDLCYAYEGGSDRDGNAKFYIGYSAGGRALNGIISEVRVWARALSQSEIKNNICAVDIEVAEDLLAYWKFNNNNPMVKEFEDLTGNGFTAKYGFGNTNWVNGIRCPEN